MEATKLYKKLLQLNDDWQVTKVEIDEPIRLRRIRVFVSYAKTHGYCTQTGEYCRVHDLREEKVWRHLDTMENQTWLHCRVPRVKNSFGEISSIEVPWADNGERHTHPFENKCIKVMQATHNQTQTGTLMGVGYDKVTRIMHRAVKRGLSRRDLSKEKITQLCMDEKSYGKGHQYISVLSDPVKNRIIDVAKERTQEAAEQLLKTIPEQQLAQVKAVCCDMWDAFSGALKKTVRMPLWCMTNFMSLSI